MERMRASLRRDLAFCFIEASGATRGLKLAQVARFAEVAGTEGDLDLPCPDDVTDCFRNGAAEVVDTAARMTPKEGLGAHLHSPIVPPGLYQSMLQGQWHQGLADASTTWLVLASPRASILPLTERLTPTYTPVCTPLRAYTPRGTGRAPGYPRSSPSPIAAPPRS
jgi:hypothetical protein